MTSRGIQVSGIRGVFTGIPCGQSGLNEPDEYKAVLR